MVTDVNNIITGRPWAHSHFVFFFAVILRNFVRRSSTHNERPARGKIIMTAANNCNSIELIQTISWIYLESAVWLDGAGCRQYPRANPLASGVASELFFFFHIAFATTKRKVCKTCNFDTQWKSNRKSLAVDQPFGWCEVGNENEVPKPRSAK